MEEAEVTPLVAAKGHSGRSFDSVDWRGEAGTAGGPDEEDRGSARGAVGGLEKAVG